MKATRVPFKRGVVQVLALLLLALFVTMAAAFAVTTDVNARTSKSLVDIHRARYAAESGMSFAVAAIHSVTVPDSTTSEDAIPNIAAALATELEGTANLGGASITYDENNIYVPRIELADQAFEIRILRVGEKLVLVSRGLANNLARTVAMDLSLHASSGNTAFDYGVASMGAISVDGNGEIRGQNALNEASIISVSEGPVAISVGGNAIIDGDLSSVGTDTSVVITGTPTIAGSQDPQEIAEHVHFGVAAPVFPTVDTSVFEGLTTTVIDTTTDTSQHGLVFDNPVIKAGTNPTFANDVVLNGVVYVEAPNIVTFAAKVTLNGLVATDPAEDPIESCKISFGGQVESFGVEALPDLPQYAEVKQLDGTFVVAPGFDVSFAGLFTTINGTIAADKLSFSGQACGTVEGSVIGLADEPMYIGGTVNIVIDQEGGGGSCPPGFSMPLSLDVDSRTYREVTDAEL